MTDSAHPIIGDTWWTPDIDHLVVVQGALMLIAAPILELVALKDGLA